MELRQYIYLSRLSGSIGETGLREIMQRSRENNAKHDVTGALLFDGESFVQLIEGPSDQVLALIELIESDSRHFEFTTVCNMVASSAQRRCVAWRNGYVESETLELFRAQAVSSSVDPAQLLEGFLFLLVNADVI